jgi:hypothetical protein
MVVSALVVYSGYGCYLWSIYDPFPGWMAPTSDFVLRKVLEKVALMSGDRLNKREVMRSHAKPVAGSKRGAKEKSTRQPSFHVQKAAVFSELHNDGAFSKWMHRSGEHDIGRHIDEHLGLEEGTY